MDPFEAALGVQLNHRLSVCVGMPMKRTYAQMQHSQGLHTRKRPGRRTDVALTGESAAESTGS